MPCRVEGAPNEMRGSFCFGSVSHGWRAKTPSPVGVLRSVKHEKFDPQLACRSSIGGLVGAGAVGTVGGAVGGPRSGAAWARARWEGRRWDPTSGNGSLARELLEEARFLLVGS